jgi:hypothetical protein
MPSLPRLSGASLLVITRTPDLWPCFRRTRCEPIGPQMATAGAAPAMRPLPPEGALLADGAASCLLEQLPSEGRDDPRVSRSVEVC